MTIRQLFADRLQQNDTAPGPWAFKAFQEILHELTLSGNVEVTPEKESTITVRVTQEGGIRMDAMGVTWRISADGVVVQDILTDN
jgi:uncharacterized cupin superfamily protein